MLNRKVTAGALVLFIFSANFSYVYGESLSDSKSRIKNFPKPRKFPEKFQKMNACELNFISQVQGKLPAMLGENSAVNLWDELFDARILVDHLENQSSEDVVKFLENLAQYSTNELVYAKNVSEVVSAVLKSGKVSMADVKRIFLSGEINDTRYMWSNVSKRLTAQVEFSEGKRQTVNSFIAGQKLSKASKKDYEKILIQSKLSEKQIKFAIKNGLKFKEGNRYAKQFEEYIKFLEDLSPSKIKRGLKDVDSIYNFDFTASPTSWATFNPKKRFLVQQQRTREFRDQRFIEIYNDMKLKENTKLIDEINSLAAKRQAGEFVDQREALRLRKKLDEVELPPSMRARAFGQAAAESKILNKIRAGCNSGSSPALKKTAKKFAWFKFGLTMTTTPLFYYLKNKDKLKTDTYWYEKLGYEMTMGIVFTFVANKLFTNSQTSFWKKYMVGLLQFGTLDGFNSFGYEKLFGARAMVRYFQRLYSPATPESELEVEYKKLVNSPDFKKNLDELMDYLEERSKDMNTKHYLEKYLNLESYQNLTDEQKITLEDLESEEAKEILMELVAERMYLLNMGNNSFFQTGAHGADRWLFYRSRNILNDVKGLALNLTVFQIMCREPFGKVGSWIAVLALTLGNDLIAGNITYKWRRDFINQ